MAINILAGVLGVAWIAFSFRYGPDPNTSPVLRYSMIGLGCLVMLGCVGVARWGRQQTPRK